VADHCEGIRTVLEKGTVGETYNLGSEEEKPNIEIVHMICDVLDELRPQDPVIPHRGLIRFVKTVPAMTVATQWIHENSTGTWLETS
jgi:dTDP-glucose 4,6-dehydratase